MKLESILELMHTARGRYTTIEAQLRRRYEPGSDFGSLGSEQVEAIDHIWFESPMKWRVDAESGPGTGLVTIHDGHRVVRNFEFENLVDVYSRSLYLGGPQTYRQVMWDPNILIPEMWLEPHETESVGGRKAVRVYARPRRTSHDYVVLWPRADRYELMVDLERGILLRLSHFLLDRAAVSDEVLAVNFDRPVTDEVMRVDPNAP